MDPIRSKTTRRMLVLAVAGLLVLASSPAAFGGSRSSNLQVVGYQVSGSFVNVTVHNTGSSMVSGVVSVQALVGDTPIWGVSPVVVSAGGTLTVAVPFGGSVQQVIDLGASSDDFTPF